MDTEKIYQAIVKLADTHKTPVLIDSLCEECHITKEFLSSHLRILQLFNRVKIIGGGKYVAIL